MHKLLKRILLSMAALGLVAALPDGAAPAQTGEGEKPKVYFSKDLSPAGLKKMYALVSQNLDGKIAVKLHTGEPNGPYIIPPAWVEELLADIADASIVECNVYYGSPRQTTAGHRELLETNGWTFAPVDIMDAEGDVNLPVPGGKWFKEVAMGKNLVNYDSMLVLTHFKGHPMGGYGGALKNIAIGCASGKVGKAQLHSDGNGKWSVSGERFMEHMVEAGKAITAHFGPKMAYINVLNNISVDCDCMGASAATPTVPDIGILASTDILAVEQASVDMIYALPEHERRHLAERIESRGGLRQLSYMDEMGMGSREYELVIVD